MPNQGPQYPQGFEFRSPQGARAANAYAISQSVLEQFNKSKATKFERDKNQADYLMSEYIAARGRGDTEMANHILNDPKFAKIMKEMEGFVPIEQPTKPAAVAGAEQAFTKAAQQQNQAPAQSAPRSETGAPIMPMQASPDQQLQDMISKARLSAVQKDPALLQRAATGSGLTGSEQTQVEKTASGLEVSPVALAQMESGKAELTIKGDYEIKAVQTDNEGRMAVARFQGANEEKLTKMRIDGDLKVADKRFAQMNNILGIRDEGIQAQALAAHNKALVDMAKSHAAAADKASAAATNLLIKDPSKNSNSPEFAALIATAAAERGASKEIEGKMKEFTATQTKQKADKAKELAADPNNPLGL
jgi:hypothetical protein